ncbi:MAG: arginine--tRNA ligase [Archaeoglobales archaeon]|nr:arginine--tRNA ligase [Archaeoglobales archaeon]
MFLKFIEDVKRALKDYGDEKFIKESEHADLCTTIAFKLAKEMGKSPDEVASEIAENIEMTDYISSVHVVNGYVNFFASDEFLNDTMEVILSQDENYGNVNLKGEILVEHTSANPDGPLHIGHVRNAVIGDTLARILRKAGYDVRTHYYVNDMGRQAAVTVLGYELFGLSDKKPDHAVADSYIKANVELEKNPELEKKVEELMLKYEQGDAEIEKKFKFVIGKGLEGIRQTLKRMNVEHDEFVWESEFVKNGYVEKILKMLDEKQKVEKDGAWIIRLEGFEKEVVLKRENGTTLYITRDLAYHMWKNEKFKSFVNVLGADHKLYAAQLSKLLEILNLKPPEVVIFEFVSLPEGKMSTRKGRFVSADELIDKVKEEAKKILANREMDEKKKDEIAESVAIAAIRFDFVKVAPEKHMFFDWNQALDFERQTASYIQYAHARACSILRRAVDSGMPEIEFNAEMCNKEERKLVMLLSKFPYWIYKASKDLRPHYIAEYLLSVAGAFNDFYRLHPVLKSESAERMHRLAIVDATRIVLRNGLELLGIKPLEKM